MNFKKFYGSTIQEARTKAQSAYGKDVVILETIQPKGDKDAAVTALTPRGANGSSASSSKSIFAYGRKDIKPKRTLKKEPEPAQTKANSSVQQSKKTSPGVSEELKQSEQSQAYGQTDKQSASRHFDQLIGDKDNNIPPADGNISRRSNALFNFDQKNRVTGNGVTNNDLRWNNVQQRLNSLEALLSEYLISVNLDFVTHPVFQQLLSNGVDVITISQWINDAVAAGHHPTDDIEVFALELKSVIEQSLVKKKQTKKAPHMAFIGPSGAGKTTTIMKLASMPSLCGGKKVALVSVEPFKDSPANVVLHQFAKDKNLPFFRIASNAEMSGALSELQEHFDTVFYDTPAHSVIPGKAFNQFWKIRQTLASVQPLDIHLVVNATLERRYLKEISSAEYPLDPDYLCLTHIDETKWWGHILPLAKRLGTDIRFLGTGSGSSDEDIRVFDPVWFTQKILNKNEGF